MGIMYDIAIIGLGPAGATLARLLDSSFRVIAIDRKSAGNSDGFRKPCGGLLATDAQRVLSRFNLTLPKEVLVDPQIFAVKTIDTKQNLQRNYQRFYINLDRHKFDLWLMSLIPGHIEVSAPAACVDIRRDGNGFQVTFREDGQTRVIRARHVVGGDGSNSIVRKALFPHKKIRRYVSIQQWFPETHATPFYSSIFDSEITDCYCWSVSKDGCFILGGAFPIKSGRKRFDMLRDRLEKKGFLLGEPIRTEACLVSRPAGLRSFCAGYDGAFLVGEAAGFISPSSLEGISYALNSARMLAGILNTKTKNPNWTYRIKTLPIRLTLLAKYLKSPFMYNPFLRRLVMKSGLSAIRVTGDPDMM